MVTREAENLYSFVSAVSARPHSLFLQGREKFSETQESKVFSFFTSYLSYPYIVIMKILVACRQWRRPRNIRKRFALHRSKDKKEQPQPEIQTRRSIEKLVYSPELVELIEMKTPQPPTYAESVDFAPPLHPPPEKERGRPRELLYKSQLNDIMLRRPKGPSPAARKVFAPTRIDATNYRLVKMRQAHAASWEQVLGMVKVATMVWLIFTCLMALVWSGNGKRLRER